MSTWASEVGGCRLLGWASDIRWVRACARPQPAVCSVPHLDKFYWTHGYVLISKEVEACVPVFLKHIAHDVYVCGKTINLLKLCCPRVSGPALLPLLVPLLFPVP